MRERKKIIIIGGSIAGLTTALSLINEGFDVTVFEREKSRTSIDVSLTLFPNAMKVLSHLDLVDKISDYGNRMSRVFIKRANGKRLMTTDLRKYKPRPICIRKMDLHYILSNEVGLSNIVRGHEFESFEQVQDKVIVTFTNGNKVEADLLIGSDGINSKVRKQIIQHEDDKLIYSGYTCWRGSVEYNGPIEDTEIWGSDKRAIMLKTGKNKVGWWLTSEEDPNTSDDPEGRRAKLLRLFKNWMNPLEELIVQTEYISKKDIHDRFPIKGWSKGNAIVIGDAAHPATPNLGQGGCSAIEDAAVLTRCLMKYSNTEQAFKQFEKIRFPRTRSIVHDSRILGTMGQWSNPLAVAFRNMVIQKNQASPLYNSIQKYFDYDVFSVEV